MKKQIIIILFLSLFLFQSCSKKENPIGPLGPLLKMLTLDGLVFYSYLYDDNGRITIMTSSGIPYGNQFDSTTFYYQDNMVTKKLYTDGILSQIEYGTIHNGFMVSMHGAKIDSSLYWNIDYTYNANGFLIREIHNENGSVSTWQVDYEIVDGNVGSKIRTGTNPVTYTYIYYEGSLNTLGIIQQGTWVGTYNKNLYKSVTRKNNFTNTVPYFYTFDDNGFAKTFGYRTDSYPLILDVSYW